MQRLEPSPLSKKKNTTAVLKLFFLESMAIGATVIVVAVANLIGNVAQADGRAFRPSNSRSPLLKALLEYKAKWPLSSPVCWYAISVSSNILIKMFLKISRIGILPYLRTSHKSAIYTNTMEFYFVEDM
jgi:hypothetical protein